MEPVTWIIIMMVTVLAGGGVGRQVATKRRKVRRKKLNMALLTKMPLTTGPTSVFDIFWDLGATDWALVIMAHRDLLAQHPHELPKIEQKVQESIEAHGSYEGFIHDTLEAIAEVSQDHLNVGPRRLLPQLTTNTQRLLPVGQVQDTSVQEPSNQIALQELEQEIHGVEGLDFESRNQARHTSGVSTALVPTASETVDLDDMLRAKPMEVLQSLFQGGVSKQIKRWIELRQLRSLRKDLDAHLIALYRDFDAIVSQDANVFDPLYDLTKRWSSEQLRLQSLMENAPWKGRPWELASELLTYEAEVLAKYIAKRSRKNADDVISTLRLCVSTGQLAQAGYLVYQNRFVFFAGRQGPHVERFAQIEYTTAKIQSELRVLHQDQLTRF